MFGAGCAVVVQVAGTARASAAEPAKLEGFDVLGNVGYGVALDSYVDYALIEDTDADPLGFLVGLDFGYTWRFGLRLGATATHGFGREFEETRTTLSTHHSSNMLGGSVGYDWLLAPIRLRASLDGGMLFLNSSDGNQGVPAFGPLIAPGVAAFWQHGALQLGINAKYVGWVGFTGSLMGGARW